MGTVSKRVITLILTLSILLLSLGACAPSAKEEDYTDLSVRDYIASNGIVTAANPYAAKIGLDILQNGGNAFDAGVAVSFAIGVAESDANGIGGGGLMIAYNANTQQSDYYNFREFAPSNVSLDVSDYNSIVTANCAIESAVPTQVAGLLSILEDRGTMTRQQVLAPSVHLARTGVVVTPELAHNISAYADLIEVRNGYDVASVFKKDMFEALGVGDLLVQEDLAKSLEYISQYGAEGFYTGEMAQRIVQQSAAHGGAISMQDMQYALDNYPNKGQAIVGSYNDYDILTVDSPSTGGIMLIQMLNMLESYGDLSQLQHNSAEYINLLATVMQLSYGDKEKYMADSNFVDMPAKGLLNKQYAAQRMTKYARGSAYQGTAQGDLPYGDPMAYQDTSMKSYRYGNSGQHSSTTSFSVVDKLGNMVTFTQTINNFFGSGLIPQDCGFFLNNELRDFSYVADSINCIQPYKQPASYMAPTIIIKDNEPYATLGSPGGSRIPSALLQVAINMMDFDMTIQQAIDAARIYCFTTDASFANATDKAIEIENALIGHTDALTNMGYSVTIKTVGSSPYDSYFGGVQGIRVLPQNFHGGADPRRDGKALGY